MRTENLVADKDAAPLEADAQKTTVPVVCEDLLHLVEYPSKGLFSAVLTRSKHCTYTLLGLAARNSIVFHNSGGNISIQVVHGRGVLDFVSKKMEIEEGMFLFIPPHVTQGLQAETNLAVLHCVIHE